MSVVSYPLNAIVHALENGHVTCAVLERQDFLQYAHSTESAKRALMRQLEASWVRAERAPLLELHRLSAIENPEQRTLRIELKSPTRQVAWSSPWEMDLDCMLFTEANDRHHVVLPGPGLHFVVNERADENKLGAQVLQQVQAWLGLLPVSQRLAQVATLARYQGAFKLQREQVDFLPNSAKQREQNQKNKAETVLKAVATPLANLDQHSVGLDALATRVADVLTAVIPRSALLIGPAGCGKTSACLALATRASFPLQIHTTSGTRLIAGQSGFGMWQARCQQLIRELAQKKDVLHVGNLLELMEVGRTRKGEQSIASFMRADIARGSALVIAECTPEQFGILARLEPGLLDAFEHIECSEPSLDAQRVMLNQLAQRWLHSPLTPVHTNALNLCLELHEQFCGYSARPAKVIGFLARLCQRDNAADALNPDSVLRQFLAETGLPELLLRRSIKFQREAISEWFAERVMGQTRAVQAVVDRLSQIKAQLFRRQRPLASLVLIGPTGVGKTELAKSLAEFLFGSAQRLLRFDLSQATDALAVQRLIGSKAFGDSEGLLTARVREQPFSVLLLDEFEKADASFYDLLLQILGDGRISDGNGRVADFSNCVILLTSNLGAKARQKTLGFAQQAADDLQHYQRALQAFLRPEIYNRFDAIVPFESLAPEQIKKILQRELAQLKRRRFFLDTGTELSLAEPALAKLGELGFDAQFGARALKRAVETHVAQPLARMFAVQKQVDDAMQAKAKREPHAYHCDSEELALKRIETNAKAAPERDESARELALHAGALRRDLDALSGCEEVQSWSDERMLLEQQRKRAQKRKRDLTEREIERIAALSQALDRMHKARSRSEAIEDQCVVAALSGVGAASPTELAQARAELQPIKESLLRLRVRDPDTAQVALIADHAEFLLFLLTTYQSYAKQQKWTITLTHVIERPPAKSKSSESKVLRIIPTHTLKDAELILSEASSSYLGAVITLHGPLAALKMALENGLQVWRIGAETASAQQINAGEHFALLRNFDLKYRADFAWSKPGQLGQLNETRRRVFDLDRGELIEAEFERVIPRLKFPAKKPASSSVMVSSIERAWHAELLRFGAQDDDALLRELG
jgi:ATP-dependent Clp protease ATP-binding subunit ClpC